MDEKIFNNILLLIVILYIIKNASPRRDSVLYIAQKYLNYIVFKIKNITTKEDFKTFNNRTFTGMIKYNNNVPSFKTSHEINFVNYFLKLYPTVDEKTVYQLYNFIKNLVSIDTDPYFSTPSDITENSFTENEKLKLQKIILNKLNSGTQFSFSEFNFKTEPKYYLNINGKELDPFICNVKSNIGIIHIYVDINIRNDVHENKEFIVINDIKPITNKNVPFNNQYMTHNNNKPKIKRKPFTGDVNLIFTNNSTDDYTYDDIQVEQIPNSSNLVPVYDHTANYYSRSQENLKSVSDNLVAFNENNEYTTIENSISNIISVNNNIFNNNLLDTNLFDNNLVDNNLVDNNFDDNKLSFSMPSYTGPSSSLPASSLAASSLAASSLPNKKRFTGVEFTRISGSRRPKINNIVQTDNNMAFYNEEPVDNNTLLFDKIEYDDSILASIENNLDKYNKQVLDDNVIASLNANIGAYDNLLINDNDTYKILASTNANDELILASLNAEIEDMK